MRFAPDDLPHGLREAMVLQEIAGNPLAEDDVALFVMFERENWRSEKRLAYIKALARKESFSAVE